MTTKTPIFLIGATGYIGGSVLSRLLSHPNASSFEITAIVRTEDKAKQLEAFGVKTAIGSFKTDVDLVEKLSEAAHVVFHCGDADDLPSVKAVCAGLKSRHEKLGDLPIYIHTSGTGLLTDGAETKGLATTDTIYDDANADQMNSFPPTALHRDVDLVVLQADKEGYARTYIVLPSTIYGIESNPLVDAGIMNPISQQVPGLIRAALSRGRVGMVGKGLAYWPSVHIDDVADLYILLFDKIVSDPEVVDHGDHGYYFGVNGEHLWYELSKEIGRVLVELGVQKEDEPTAFTEEELVKYFGDLETGYYFGTNSRGRATHSLSLGWKPKYNREDFFKSIKPEVENLLKQHKKE